MTPQFDDEDLKDILDLVDATNLVDADIEVQADTFDNNTVYYIVIKGNPDKRVATFYTDQKESYDAQAAAEICAAAYSLIPDIIDDIFASRTNNSMSAASFLIDRIIESIREENPDSKTVIELLGAVNELLKSHGGA